MFEKVKDLLGVGENKEEDGKKGRKKDEKNKKKKEIIETQQQLNEVRRLIESFNAINIRRPADQPPLKKDANGLYKIICPYCLEEFEVIDLAYRATVIEQENMEDTFANEFDQAFDNYWTKVGAIGQDSNRPHILNVDPDAGEISTVRLLINKQQVEEPYTAETREKMKKHQVVYMKDRYGHVAKTRICPHCHTELPADMGFCPNYIFSLVGNSGCGKTVYLLRLIASLCNGNFMGGDWHGTVINDDATLDYRITTLAKEIFKPGKPMSEATDVGYIRPVILRLTNRKTSDMIYLTLFDFPGEGIWRTDNTFFQDLAEKNFMNSNGWIFMFDPGTLPFINNKLDENTRQIDLENANLEQKADPNTILEQVRENYGFGMNFTKPIAFVLSKSDMIRECLPQLVGLRITENPRFLINPELHNKVDMKDLYNCDQELRTLLGQTNVISTGDIFCDKDCSWFAISSTNVSVVNDRIEEGNVPSGLRDTTPLEWLLYRCGQIEGEFNENDGDEELNKKVIAWAVEFQKGIGCMEEHQKNCDEYARLDAKLKELQRR